MNIPRQSIIGQPSHWRVQTSLYTHNLHTTKNKTAENTSRCPLSVVLVTPANTIHHRGCVRLNNSAVIVIDTEWVSVSVITAHSPLKECRVTGHRTAWLKLPSCVMFLFYTINTKQYVGTLQYQNFMVLQLFYSCTCRGPVRILCSLYLHFVHN